MKKITKPSPKEVNSVAAFRTQCGCWTCTDCRGNASAAQGLAANVESSIASYQTDTNHVQSRTGL